MKILSILRCFNAYQRGNDENCSHDLGEHLVSNDGTGFRSSLLYRILFVFIAVNCCFEVLKLVFRTRLTIFVWDEGCRILPFLNLNVR